MGDAKLASEVWYPFMTRCNSTLTILNGTIEMSRDTAIRSLQGVRFVITRMLDILRETLHYSVGSSARMRSRLSKSQHL